MRTRPNLPAGHGELLTQPDFARWPELAERNREAARAWDFDVAGLSAVALRGLARREALERASLFSERLGVPVRTAGAPEAPIVLTGHQPDLYHPGVWVKCFLLQRIAELTGATALDLVVDSDGFESVSVTSPCMSPGVARCRQYLAMGGAHACFALASVPSERDVETFCAATNEALATLSAPSISRHFGEFCSALRSATSDANNLAELITFARRRYEISAGSDYLELPVTTMAGGEAFARFVVQIALDAARFSADYNAELDDYRVVTGTRSEAQPFPDLRAQGDALELPLWLLGDAGRHSVWARRSADGVSLAVDGDAFVVLPLDPDAAVAALRASSALLVPKALALTMFVRLFACDLFIHGVGGGRYDRVTDGVIRRYFGVEAPAFVVASITLYLPLGAHVVTDKEVAEATERLNRLAHNPDAILGEVDFDTPGERERSNVLAAEKADLVVRIAQAGADKKTLGMRIRQVNSELAELLTPVQVLLTQELERLSAQRDASQILTDRNYPFCFWDPAEVADKVR